MIRLVVAWAISLLSAALLGAAATLAWVAADLEQVLR